MTRDRDGVQIDTSEITLDVRAWLMDSRRMAMTLEAEAAFIRLVFWAQIDADHPGSLPDDDAALAHLSKAGARWPAISVSVRSMFEVDEDTGRLFWPEQRERLDAEIESKIRRREAGSLGGRSKAARAASKPAAESSPDDAAFDEIKREYPERIGGQNWRDARAGFNASRRKGVPAADILAGVKRYKAFVVATRRIGTEYTKQASTFLGRGEHWREPWEIPANYVHGADTRPARESIASRQFRSIAERQR